MKLLFAIVAVIGAQTVLPQEQATQFQPAQVQPRHENDTVQTEQVVEQVGQVTDQFSQLTDQLSQETNQVSNQPDPQVAQETNPVSED